MEKILANRVGWCAIIDPEGFICQIARRARL